jgi:hypothetical protein
MGGPISRKAILGGRCTDTGEDLGNPLTNIVHIYLSIAGVQRSSSACGVNCGQNCGGIYFNDINSRKHYEGEKVFVLLSQNDETIRRDRCGHFISELVNSDKTVSLSGYGHIAVCLNTAEIQYQMLNGQR